MAYNGGATAATVDTIQHEEKWSPAGIGLLGSMDKIGMTMAAAFWGYMLQRYSSKLLLCIGLLVNSASTMAFGTLRNPTAKCLAKLLIGFTESLQWVWAPLWIGKWATAESLPIWMNLSGGGVSSGVGNGLGTIIAGYTTAQGFSYEFAFQIEASVLFLLSLPLLVTSEDMLIYRDDAAPPVKIKSPVKRVVRLSDGSLDEHLVDAAGQPSQPSVRPAPKETVASQLGELWGNPLLSLCDGVRVCELRQQRSSVPVGQDLYGTVGHGQRLLCHQLLGYFSQQWSFGNFGRELPEGRAGPCGEAVHFTVCAQSLLWCRAGCVGGGRWRHASTPPFGSLQLGTEKPSDHMGGTVPGAGGGDCSAWFAADPLHRICGRPRAAQLRHGLGARGQQLPGLRHGPDGSTIDDGFFGVSPGVGP